MDRRCGFEDFRGKVCEDLLACRKTVRSAPAPAAPRARRKQNQPSGPAVGMSHEHVDNGLWGAGTFDDRLGLLAIQADFLPAEHAERAIGDQPQQLRWRLL